MKKKQHSAAAMADMLNTNLENARSQEDLLAGSDEPTTPIDQEVIDNARTQQQEQLSQAAGNSSVRHLNPKVDRRAKLTGRIKDTILTNLDKYISPKSGSSERIQALAKVVDGVVKQPTKDILDAILAFFITNKDHPQLQECNALKSITELDEQMNYRVRIFYVVMISLANGTATKSNTSIEMIRNIFKADDFPNWVAIRIAKRR